MIHVVKKTICLSLHILIKDNISDVLWISIQFQSTQPYRVEFAIESKNEHSSEHRSGFADCSEYFKLHGKIINI